MASKKPPVEMLPWQCPCCKETGLGGHAGWVHHYVRVHLGHVRED